MKRILIALLAAAMSGVSAFALEAPTGLVILTVKGAVTNTNVGDTAAFDFAMLEKLESRQAVVETPWTTGKTTFEGPLLRAVLQEAGASGKTLTVRALNDYSAEIPIVDAEIATILAIRQDGQRMSVREKGPMMLVYPFDLEPGLYNEKYFSRSVWQIKEIEVAK
ncbi:hypothetical protein PDO_0617 [Rhizobium sp. PDO1-076]|uniref:molybdopterin-dependent oxidoreductase n=1 Tax=Rhizobium sp. PDO1-076 TaxID=1125979 RepID=UPI00024E29E9|nr:molybdopterin-dependent oxidoreductase [Rhizobium sp. PDO1-076]EHS49239.1 hypothetical protein PDO_0617 [Rhizobium sp. PDO1-076]